MKLRFYLTMNDKNNEWLLSDLKNNVLIEFKNKKFETTAKHGFIEKPTEEEMQKNYYSVIQEMKRWLLKKHPDKV